VTTSPINDVQRSSAALPTDIASIQYLRGFAAIMVVFGHANGQFRTGVHPALEILGGSGVDLFFVISGFIMTYTVTLHHYSRKEFMLRRVARIAPMYWATSVLTALLVVFLPALFQTTHFGWSNFLQSLAFIWSRDPVTGDVAPTLHLGWTLNYEMFFYLCFAACLFLRPLQRLGALASIFVALVLLAGWTNSDSPSLMKYGSPITFEFLFGSAVAAAFLGRRLANPPVAALAAILAIGVVGLIAGGIFADADVTHDRWLLRGIPAAVILWALVAIELRHPWKNPVLHRIGDATYSIYLTHIFVVESIKFVWRHAHLPDGEAAIYVFVLICVVAAIVVGVIVYELAEKRMNRWAKDLLLGPRIRTLPAST
jgi:exopolysaccharide production protein ExoZ